MTIKQRIEKSVARIHHAERSLAELPGGDEYCHIDEGIRDAIACRLASAQCNLANVNVGPVDRALAARELVFAWQLVTNHVPIAVNGNLRSQVWRAFSILVA